MERTALLKKVLGRKGTMFLLYLGFFALHSVISAASYLPSIDPNEFSSAALANMFIGGDWTAAMSRNNYFYGFIQALLYVPVMLITKDPFIQYRLMAVMNGAVMSFIPVIVYSCCFMLGVKKSWQAVLSAICCGGWMTYVIHSKFIWNETAAIFMPWLILYVLLRADKASGKASKAALSVILAFLAAVSYCAHQRLIALILALAVTVILSRTLLKRKSVNLPAFFVSLVIFGALAVLGNYSVQNILWGVSDPTQLQNTAESFFAGLPSALSDGGVLRFVTALASQLYYYICASWGLGALGLSLLVVTMIGFFSSQRGKRCEDPRFVFIFFAVLLTVFMLFIGACYRFGAENFETSQSTLLFGRYMDSVIPFTVLFVLIHVHTGELNLTEILGGFIAASASYLCFSFTGRQAVLDAVSATISPMLGLYPVMFGESTDSLVTSTGLIAAISCAMCLLAVLVVIESCARKLKKVIMTGAVTLLTVYSLCFGVFYYLPLSSSQSVAVNAEYAELSSYLYNGADAPDITVYQCPRNCVMMMQYMNQNLTVHTASLPEDIPEDTYIIVPSEVQLRLEGQKTAVARIAQTENYIIYAYGERAQAYAQIVVRE